MSLLLLLQNGKAEPEPEVLTPNRLRVVEKPPMRQYLIATSPNGAVKRWGEDEPDAADVLEDLSDSDTAPGGHKDLTGALPRKPGIDYSDMRMGTKLEVFGAGQYKVSEYRLERAPRTSGDYLVMDPAASGFQVLLSDKEEAREIFMDAELGGWGGPSAQRRLNLSGEAISSNDVSTETGWQRAGAASPGVSFNFQTFVKAVEERGESWYDSGGIDLGVLRFDFWPSNGASASWYDIAGFSTDDLLSAFELAEGSGLGTGELKAWSVIAKSPGLRYALICSAFKGSEYEGEAIISHAWRNLRVLGRHGLPVYGTWPEIGVLASDVIAYALSRWAPGLRFTTGPYGSVRASQFVIPHLVFREPTTVLEMITQALRFELLEWGVWPGQFGPTFYLNERGKREGAKRWRARIRPAKLTETGQQMDQLYNRVVMSWQDPDGTTRTMGPVGSGFPYTDSRCEDLDPENPLNEAGLIRTKHLTMNGMGTASGAAEQSRLFLEKCRLLNSSGEATLTGYVEDEHGIEWPYYCVHAGDQIEFLDSSIKGYRYIIEATRSRKSRSVNVKLDAPPDSYEAILAELQVRETVAGVGR